VLDRRWVIAALLVVGTAMIMLGWAFEDEG
jgi:hypothetical protein